MISSTPMATTLCSRVLLAALLALCGAAGLFGADAYPAWRPDEDLSPLTSLGTVDHRLTLGEMPDPRLGADVWGKIPELPAWQPAEPDPQLYLLTELDHNPREKRNRNGSLSPRGSTLSLRSRDGSANQPRLSIVNPLDVLRQRLLLEIARRRKWQSTPQSQDNREMLENIGKRSEAKLIRCLDVLKHTPFSVDNPRLSSHWKTDYMQRTLSRTLHIFTKGKCYDEFSDDFTAGDQHAEDRGTVTADRERVSQQDQLQQQRQHHHHHQQQQQQQQQDAVEESHADSVVTGDSAEWPARRRTSDWSRS